MLPGCGVGEMTGVGFDADVAVAVGVTVGAMPMPSWPMELSPHVNTLPAGMTNVGTGDGVGLGEGVDKSGSMVPSEETVPVSETVAVAVTEGAGARVPTGVSPLQSSGLGVSVAVAPGVSVVSAPGVSLARRPGGPAPVGPCWPPTGVPVPAVPVGRGLGHGGVVGDGVSVSVATGAVPVAEA